MKVILDTNIFVSGLHWQGASAKVIDAWSDGKFELVSSEDIIEELTNTLLGFKKKALPLKIILERVTIITAGATIVHPSIQHNAVKADPDDNKFIDAAVEANADYIVTQDNDLLRIKEFQGVKIVKPEEFLKVVKEEEDDFSDVKKLTELSLKEIWDNEEDSISIREAIKRSKKRWKN